MKIETATEFIDYVSSLNLNPNEFSTLYFIFTKKKAPKTLNIDGYKSVLYTKGWIDGRGNLNDKSISLFETSNIDNQSVERYRQMWPSIVLPNGKYARSSHKELEVRFKWFFENFSYDWETIYKATEEYLKYYEERRYNFMRTSGFFIYKESSPKLRTSDLAEWCDKTLSVQDSHTSYDIEI